MITTRYYLDTRATDGEAPLKLAIHKRHAGAFLGTGIRLLPSQWDARAQRVINHPQKGALNSFLGGFKFKVDTFIRDAVLDGSAADMTARDIKDWLDARLHGKRDGVTFGEQLRQVMSGVTEGTRRVYASMLTSVLEYDPNAESRPLSGITEKWVADFIHYLADNGRAVNTQAVYFARLRRLLNIAVKEGHLPSNPCAGIRVKVTPTRHRDLSAAQMRLMLSAPPASEAESIALDLFALSFFSRAANPRDIFNLTPANIYNGRLDYTRAKTDKVYSVRIEPELQSLLDKHSDGLRLFSPAAGYRSYYAFLAAQNAALRARSTRLGLPSVSMYWARHTFASLAFELGYGMDLVAAALGHSLPGGARVTSTYVNIVDKQVDDLARAVYDYIAPSAHSGSVSDDSNSVPVGGSSR